MIMAEEEGFEPPRAVTPLSVFETDPFSQTWVLLHFDDGAYRTPACGAGALLAERKPHHEMIGKTGFEPATSRTRTVCSTKLSYFPFISIVLSLAPISILYKKNKVVNTFLVKNFWTKE
jgi:hypothetical protein